MKSFWERRKGLILSVGIIAFVVSVFVATGGVRFGGGGGNEPESLPIEPKVVADIPADIPLDDSVTGEKLGVVGAPPSGQYAPTEQEVIDVVAGLVAFDSTTQRYDEWHERADGVVAYTEQDFPKEAVLSYTPSPEEWDEGWVREFNPMGADELPTYLGQGAGRIYTWQIDAKQDLIAPDGTPWVGGFTEITAALQCAGSDVSTCQVLTYTGTWPLRFDEERALGEP